jgi:calcium-activated chloride channel regulator 1/calcium-activated chloride channel regulator 2/calcium-activated chloride channel regulator 4
LESKVLNITRKKWINGKVSVDSTIGNDTFFVVTWTMQKPEIILQDPKGKQYKTSDFKEDKLNIQSARLRIPGIAEVGIFFYFHRVLFINSCIKNKDVLYTVNIKQ